ncbi:hypothetical protein U1Q18_048416 [Sarracenia purpurea var. burkii]
MFDAQRSPSCDINTQRRWPPTPPRRRYQPGAPPAHEFHPWDLPTSTTACCFFGPSEEVLLVPFSINHQRVVSVFKHHSSKLRSILGNRSTGTPAKVEIPPSTGLAAFDSAPTVETRWLSRSGPPRAVSPDLPLSITPGNPNIDKKSSVSRA